MKHRKWILAFVLVFALLAVVVPQADPVDAARILTMDKATQINDYQIVLEFSEPIAINLKQQNAGPYCAVRMVVNQKNQYATTEEGTVLQWKGSIEYADANKDKLLWTLADNRLGVTTVSDIINYRGQLAKYSDYAVRFCVEEMPFDTTIPAATGLLDNVTTLDGEVHLSANRPIGYDGAYVPIEVNFNYPIDLTKTQSLVSRQVDAQISVSDIPYGAQVNQIIDTTPDPMVAAIWIGGSVLLAVAMIVIGAVCAKKRRKAV